MALINFQAALYFLPKPDNARLIASLRRVLSALNQELNLNVRPMAAIDAEILGGNEARFQENGKQLFLLYDEERTVHDTNEWSLYISFLDEYPHCCSIHITPELPELTRELTNFVWDRLLSISKILVLHMEPLIAQINGLDEETGGQVLSPERLSAERLPEFFTPYTYLDQSLADESAMKQLKAAGAYRVEKFPSGWSLQLVKDFYTKPSRKLKQAIRDIQPPGKVYYKQTPAEGA